MNTRMDRTKLNIGTYFLRPYACDEQHVKELAECGINMVVCMQDDKKTLDLFEKYHIGAVVNGVLPGWWGGDGDNASKMAQTNPIEKYEQAAESFVDHPAIWGVDTGDEPSALDFPHYGRVIDCVKKVFPKQFPYLNLYPNYASVSQNNAAQTVNQLGTPTYAEHIAQYCKYVGTDYICYDFYMYSASVPLAYENLRIVADACRSTGRSMWIVLQVNSSRAEEWISANKLRFQAYSAMAFGAETIIWACYTAGWWHNQVLDLEGNKTEQYEKLKAVDKELIGIGGEYMKYRNVSTHFVGFDEGSQYVEKLGQKPEKSFDTGVFFGLHADEPVIVGQMISRGGDGKQAMFICAADDPTDIAPKKYKLSFKADGEIKVYSGGAVYELSRDGNNYSIEIGSNEGLLITSR